MEYYTIKNISKYQCHSISNYLNSDENSIFQRTNTLKHIINTIEAAKVNRNIIMEKPEHLESKESTNIDFPFNIHEDEISKLQVDLDLTDKSNQDILDIYFNKSAIGLGFRDIKSLIEHLNFQWKP